ncbi:MAG: oxidoreductase, partial [Actinobacteria bacterium]|nr:oxidoreductase [Actinomycetota bacterium]
MSSFLGKTLVITGAGRRAGLGEGIAQKFASLGANVVIGDIGKTG